GLDPFGVPSVSLERRKLLVHSHAVIKSGPIDAVETMGDRTGSVKFFDPQRGFGFIQSEGEDFFVHYSNIESGGGFRSLADGEEVEFDVEEDAKNGKKYCVRVTGIGGAPVRGTSRPRPDQE
ncbi:unnamed protein product, partial [Effrenium voratum]